MLGDSGDAEELRDARIGQARLEERLTAVDRMLAERGTALEDLRRDRDRERAPDDRLEAALAEARRPWLARVLGGLRRKGS